jgi:hypothetical protein
VFNQYKKNTTPQVFAALHKDKNKDLAIPNKCSARRFANARSLIFNSPLVQLA